MHFTVSMVVTRACFRGEGEGVSREGEIEGMSEGA